MDLREQTVAAGYWGRLPDVDPSMYAADSEPLDTPDPVEDEDGIGDGQLQDDGPSDAPAIDDDPGAHHVRRWMGPGMTPHQGTLSRRTLNQPRAADSEPLDTPDPVEDEDGIGDGQLQDDGPSDAPAIDDDDGDEE